MSLSNEELVEKARVSTESLQVGGKLLPAQADRFIDIVIEEMRMTQDARVIRFRNEQLEIAKLAPSSQRVATPKEECIDPGVRRGVTSSKITLQPKEISIPFEICDIAREISIEDPSQFDDSIISMMARAAANDLEAFYIGGDTLGEAALEGDLVAGGSDTLYRRDSYMGLSDGWSRLSDDGNTVDLGGASVGLNVFSQMLNAMPTRFRRNLRDMRFYMPPNLSQLYTEKLSTRATATGDAAVEGAQATPFGVPVVPVPLWDFQPKVVEHIAFTGSGSTITLRYAPVSNIVVTTSTLDTTPEAAYVLTTDYTVDDSLGTVTHSGGGSAVGATETVKVTYCANPQILLTNKQNLLLGIGRELRLEKDRDIFKGLDQYVLTLKAAVEIEWDEMVVKGVNLGTTV